MARSKDKVPARSSTDLTGRTGNTTPDRRSQFLDTEGLRQLYGFMLKYRMVLKGLGRGASPKIKSGSGREAMKVGATVDLVPGDAVGAANRDFVTEIVRGVPLAQTLARLCPPKRKGNSRSLGLGGSKRVASAGVSIATGAALGCKLAKNNNVILAFSDTQSLSNDFGDELLNFAGVHKLPIVYMAESTAIRKSSRSKRNASVGKTEVHGFPLITVDGNDVVAVYRVAHEAILRARNGGGPTLINCTLPLHSDSRRDTGSTREKRSKTLTPDPLTHLEHYMKTRNAWSDDWKRELTDNLEREVAEGLKSKTGMRGSVAEQTAQEIFAFSMEEAH